MKKLSVLLIAFAVASCSSLNSDMEITMLNTGVDNSFRALCAVNDSVIWASGSKGAVIRSLNSGATWESVDVPNATGSDFRAMHAWDKDSVLVVAVDNPALIYKTTDGGENWRKIYEKRVDGMFLNSVSFKDDKSGVIVGDMLDGEFFVLHTKDAGNSWQEVNGYEGVEGEGGFSASNTCVRYLPSGKIVSVTGMTKSNIHYTNDLSFEWTTTYTNIVDTASNGADGIYTVYMHDDMRGLVAGGNYLDVDKNRNTMAITDDGGDSWSEVTTPPHGFVSCINSFAYDRDILVANGSHGISISKDCGDNWEKVSDEGFHASSTSKDGRYIYLTGHKGRMARVNMVKR